jgi:hypothetical protein
MPGKDSRRDIEKRIAELQRLQDNARDSASSLNQHADRWNKRAEHIGAEIGKLERELAKPAEPQGGGEYGRPLVVRFAKKYPGFRKAYQYAAIKSPANGRWAITQTQLAHQPMPAMKWGELLDFIGPDHWNSIVVLADQPSTHSIIINRPLTHDEHVRTQKHLQDMQNMAFAQGRF